MKKLTGILILFLIPSYVCSQTQIMGKIIDRDNHPVIGATVGFMNSKIYTVSDSLGVFKLESRDSVYSQLVVAHKLYNTDTVDIENKTNITITLVPLQSFIGYTFKSIAVPPNDKLTVKTEIISSAELKKAACCDLAGCFETQGTVQPMTTNIISNSKELRILGLSGVYNQVLVDGMPLIQGLTYTYGISSIPGTLVDNIFVAKGTTSVLQGFESLVGQINVIPLSPGRGDKLLFNAYVNSFGESQYNMNFEFGKKKWSNLVSAHVVQPAQKWDRDRDDFLDLPLMERYMVFNKFKYGDENKNGFSSIVGLRFLWEERVGGQKSYNTQNDLGSSSIYGQFITYQQPEFYSKSGYRFNDHKKITLMASTFTHNQNAWFGSVNFRAIQKSAYANLQYELDWKDKHEFKTGISFRHLDINETIVFSDTNLMRSYDGIYHKQEQIPGLFAENTFKWRGNIINLITGIRADYHNQFGWQITPRAMLKYDLTEKSILRASLGTGWRTVNLFSENIGLLVSSRNILFKESLNPEKAFNWGFNFLQRFKKKKFEGYLTSDFYQTRFLNQFFPDYDSDPNKAYISNFTGTSISNGFQVDINAKFYKLIETKIAYNFLDVYRIVNQAKFQLPFNAKHRLLLAITYIQRDKKWRIDLNSHWTGQQRLPNTENNPIEFRQANTSKPFTTLNLQATKNWKQIEIYLGCENIFDYRQIRPIVSWQNPFSPYFDTSFNWGPTRGREIYIGIRYKPFSEN